MPRVRLAPGFFILICCLSRAADASSLGSAFSGEYSLTSINRPAGLVGGYGVGGILFEAGSPDTLFIGEYSEYGSGEILSSTVTRDPSTGSANGFTGSLSLVSTAPYIDSGLQYGPSGDLFYSAYSLNTVGEIAPGASSPAVTEAVPGLQSSTGGISFIPPGFGGAGNLAITSYNGQSICSSTVTLSGGNYVFGACTDTVTFSSPVEGIQYIAAGTPGFTVNSILVNFYQTDNVIAYQVDSNGMPILSTATTFITSMEHPDAITVDRLTGDILITSYTSNLWEVAHATAAPEPHTSTLLLAGVALIIFGAERRRRGTS